MSHRRVISAFLSVLFSLAAGNAAAVCVVNADVVAIPGTDPSQPVWTYEVHLTWSNSTGVDHWMLFLDSESGSCSCADFQAALVLPQPAGSSRDNASACQVSYTSALECAGDPRSNQTGFLITFTPNSGPACLPGTTGTGTFTFQSSLPPTPVNEGASFMVANLNLQRCAGTLTGVFPAMACDPVGVEPQTWGSIKGLYR